MDEGKISVEAIVEEYSVIIYRFIFRLVNDPTVAEDLTQDTFVKVWKNLSRYDQKQKFKTWLFAIAKNTAIDWLRRKRPLVFSQLNDGLVAEETYDFGANLPTVEAWPDEVFAKAEFKQNLNRVLEKLPLIYREVLWLRLDNDLSLLEIADWLNKPLNTVKSLNRRGLEQLRVLLLGSKEFNFAPEERPKT